MPFEQLFYFLMISIIGAALAELSINKPQRLFIAHLLTLLALLQGKATYRNLARFSHYCEKTFSRWFAKNFDFVKFNALMLHQQIIKQNQPELIAALDASFISKSGKHTQGLAYFWNGCQQQSQIGLEASLLSVVDIKANTAYALDIKQTIEQKQKTRTVLYANQVVENKNHLKQLGIKYLVVDAYYSKEKFVTPVVETDLHLIGKLRIDADLQLPWKGEYSGKGRPKRYDGKLDINGDLSKLTFLGTDENDVEMYTTEAYCKSMKMWVRVVLLRSEKKGKVSKALLFSTDVDIDPLKLVEYYKARFQIEFFFRDAKQFTGLTDCQARNKEAINFHLNASCSALNAMKLEDRKNKNTDTQTVISISSIKREKYNQHIMQLVFSKLNLRPTCKKIREVYDQLSRYGAITA